MLVIDYCDTGCCKPTIKITDTGKMTLPEKMCYILEVLGEVVVLVNGYEERILKNETDIEELFNELSQTNVKLESLEIVVNENSQRISANSDLILELSNQFEDGATGLVIDGGYFNDTEINKIYDGGSF